MCSVPPKRANSAPAGHDIWPCFASSSPRGPNVAEITRQPAMQIVKKPGANVSVRGGRAHDWAEIQHEGKIVATFGIRRGSRKDAGPGHIPSQLNLTPRQTRLLGQCPMTKDEWLGVMLERGLL